MANQPPERPKAAPVEQGAADRAVGSAIEMVDAHRKPSFAARPGGATAASNRVAP
jgi:hypothetical protein